MISPSDVLELIDPVDPDNISPQPGSYLWHVGFMQPIPPMDIYLFERTEGIEIVRRYEKKIGISDWVYYVIRVCGQTSNHIIPE